MILQNCCPPLVQVAKLGGACSQVYAVLWESAYKDVRRDPRLHKHWKTRMDCGGTTKWTIKGIAGELSTCRKRVAKALDQLLDNGFVIAEGYEQTGRGTKTFIWRIVHPDQLEARRAVIEIMGSKPSETRQILLDHKIEPPEFNHEFEEFLRQDYIDNFGLDPEDIMKSKEESTITADINTAMN